MLYQLIDQFHEANTAWAITGDEWSPKFLDMEATAPGFNRGGSEVWLWIKTVVAADFTTGDESYQFELRTSGTNDATNLNGTIRDLIMTGIMLGNDARLATAGKWILRVGLPMEAALRYWQLYCDTAGNTPIISVKAGLAPTRSAIPSDKAIQVLETNVGNPS